MLAGEKRICGKNCSFMVHSMWKNIFYAKVQEQRDELKESERLTELTKNIYKERTNITEDLLDKIEKEKLEYWFGSDEAKKLGFITDIILFLWKNI
jgi:ATP-dependent protease ClpP protease subunit